MSNIPAPGTWLFPKNPEDCFIYRVPHRLRRVNPEAYTPQLLIIGPLHHSLKSQTLKSRGDITSTKSMGYLNMEEHKKHYLEKFAQRFRLEKITDRLRGIIEENEERIRASYSESTAWIPSQEFVDMILHDSVFILEFILSTRDRGLTPARPTKTGDPLMDELCIVHTVGNDLILLENQLPYFILEKLFDPIVLPDTVRKLVITHFGFEGKEFEINSTFIHFTDLYRLVRVACPETPEGNFGSIEHMYNADKLDNGGVKFKAVKEEEFSFYVKFDNGCLEMPCLRVDDEFEMILRNIMALEQCHYPFEAHVCNYVWFLDYLVDTHNDVELLVEKGIIQNLIGGHDLVAEMVNKLCLGIVVVGSYYSDIAEKVDEHYSNPINSSRALLKRVYFGNLWTGTARVAATLLLLMTLTQTVASIIQVLQK